MCLCLITVVFLAWHAALSHYTHGFVCSCTQTHKTPSFRIETTIKQQSSQGPSQTPEEVQSRWLPFPALCLSSFISLHLWLSLSVWLLWAQVCTYEWCTTDFNNGAKTELTDIILSHICTEYNDGCWLAEKKKLFYATPVMYFLYFYMELCIILHYTKK